MAPKMQSKGKCANLLVSAYLLLAAIENSTKNYFCIPAKFRRGTVKRSCLGRRRFMREVQQFASTRKPHKLNAGGRTISDSKRPELPQNGLNPQRGAERNIGESRLDRDRIDSGQHQRQHRLRWCAEYTVCIHALSAQPVTQGSNSRCGFYCSHSERRTACSAHQSSGQRLSIR